MLHWQKVKLRKGCRTMEKEQALQALLDQVVRQGDFIGVSALYLRDGKQLAYAQAGMADRERGIPFARDTICRVFSVYLNAFDSKLNIIFSKALRSE